MSNGTTTEAVMEKITVTLWDSNSEPNIEKSFRGVWLISDVSADPIEDDSGIHWGHDEYSVAKTAKGNLAVYQRDPRERVAPSLTVFESFEELSEAKNSGYDAYPRNVVAELASALGVPFEIELDI